MCLIKKKMLVIVSCSHWFVEHTFRWIVILWATAFSIPMCWWSTSTGTLLSGISSTWLIVVSTSVFARRSMTTAAATSTTTWSMGMFIWRNWHTSGSSTTTTCMWMTLNEFWYRDQSKLFDCFVIKKG